MNKTVIISLGGSLIVPDEIDVEFLKKFKELIEKHIKLGRKFILVCGGGKTARKYENAALHLNITNQKYLDKIGIQSTLLNANLILSLFGNKAHQEIIENPTKKINSTKKIIIASGWKPGCSSDYDAALLSLNTNSKQIINLTNIDFAYNKDPRSFKDAKKLINISWKEFRKIVGNKWEPGMNTPFDPIASKLCEKEKIKVIIANGKNIENIDKIISNKEYVGTTIF